MTSEWLYTIRERFTPAVRERWQSYASFSGFRQIVELVTLDSMMCPGVVDELLDEDWRFNVHKDFRTGLFRDAAYLLGRQPLDSWQHQLLAVLEHPTSTEDVPTSFTRCGFDIMDAYFGNSTLTNCGPIPEAFSPADVNQWGLLSDLEFAIEVRDKMRQLQPGDPHLGDCDVWLVARRLPGS